MGDTIETAQHFIYVQVFLNVPLRVPLTPFPAPRFIFAVSQANTYFSSPNQLTLWTPSRHV